MAKTQKCCAIAKLSGNSRQMISLKKLLGRDDKFFDLLEAGAEEAKVSVDLFASYLKKIANGTVAGLSLDDFRVVRLPSGPIVVIVNEKLSSPPERQTPQSARPRRSPK